MRVTHSKLTVLAAAAIFGASPLAWCASNSNGSPNESKTPAAQNQSSQSQAGQNQAANSESARNQSRQDEQANAQSNSKSPQDWVIYEQDVVTLTANEPQAHFLQADRDARQHDLNGAAAELKIAARYMDLQGSRDHGANSQQLHKAADDIRDCANKLPSNKNVADSQNKLKEAYSNADLSLAEFYQSNAANELKEQKPVMAGYDLQSASTSLLSAMAWSSKTPSADQTAAINKSQTLSTELISPSSAQMASAQMASAQMSGRTPQKTSANGTGNSAEKPSANTSANQHESNEKQPNQTAINQIPSNAEQTVQNLGQTIQKCVANTTSSASAKGTTGA